MTRFRLNVTRLKCTGCDVIFLVEKLDHDVFRKYCPECGDIETVEYLAERPGIIIEEEDE